jgi:tRNA nucleotidyltransferase/poly(A) polymerase
MKIIKKYKMFLESKSDMWSIIPQSVKDLNEIFKKSGKKLYLVGGSVRDFLTGDKPKDFDLATDALPDEVIKILQSHNYDFNLQGKAFGVVVVYTDDEPMGMEIATFREDISKGRNPEVKLGVTIEDDVKRRDLTYNALFYDLDKKEIIDLTGGKDDLEKGITRMVGDPIERFEEDSLRILRAFRFASRYGHPLHIDTEKAIKKRKQLENIDPESGEMKRISQERVWEEITKAWKQAKDFNHYLNFFTKYNMWDEVFTGSNINTVLVDSKDFVVVMANLFKKEELGALRIGYNLENRLVQEYKIESDLAKKIVFLISFLNFTPEDVFDFYKKKQQSGIKDSTILEWLEVNNIDDKWMIKFIDYKPSVSAEELMKMGFKGSDLGREIKRLEIENFKNEN